MPKEKTASDVERLDSLRFRRLTGNPFHGDTPSPVVTPPRRAGVVERRGVALGLADAGFLIRNRVNCTFDPA